ncbi:GGDEF domain-containing protein [Pseudorhodoferax sp.]|uniref:GGDEF domain-containing protein n=1 Tax=Pseudorhodoferax sp. TaxID=1993553 RepID=UPI002DD65F12|nr:GGDEF domain-containing protein [Pseudorhodoferax sp.]
MIPLPPSPLVPGSTLRADLQRLWSPGPALRQRMLDDHRRLMAACFMVIGPMSMAFWLWDWAHDPVGARDTFALRLLYLLLVPTGLLVLRVRGTVPMGLLLHVTLVWTLLLFSLLLTRLAGGMQFGMAGYLTFYFFALIILGGMSLRWALLYAVLTPTVPHLMALAGWLPGFPQLAFGLLLWPMSACTVLLYVIAAQNYLRRYDLERLLEQASNTDPLTGVSNRRHFMPALVQEVQRAQRQRLALAVLMLDIDHFKRINDVHGHGTGDQTIRRLARLCVEGSRSFDLVARFGGEEFVVMLPGTGLSQATQMAERIRLCAEQAEVCNEQGQPLRFTVSVGVAVLQPGQDAQALLAQADAALYEAKHDGRNRVMAGADAPDAPDAPTLLADA